MPDEIRYARVPAVRTRFRIRLAIAVLLALTSLLALALAAHYAIEVSTGPPLPDDWGGVIAVWLLLAVSVLVGGIAAVLTLGIRDTAATLIRRYACANAILWPAVFVVLLVADCNSRPAPVTFSSGPGPAPFPTSAPAAPPAN